MMVLAAQCAAELFQPNLFAKKYSIPSYKLSCHSNKKSVKSLIAFSFSLTPKILVALFKTGLADFTIFKTAEILALGVITSEF